MSSKLDTICQSLATSMLELGYKLAVAESCTGGLVAAAATALPGSSQWFERGFVTYSNEAKISLLNVDANTLERHGAVSEATAKQMAEGALANSEADVAIATTGIAGPDGGTDDKPVGTVCFAWACRNHSTSTITQHFIGDRQSVREQATQYVLQALSSQF